MYNSPMENTINVADFCIENAEKIYGFGKRLAIWLQGCSLRCKGCINAHIWEFGKGKDMTLSQFENLLTPDLEGITLLGGEPLDQSENLLPFVLKAKEMGKTVVLFTGYRKRELSGPALKIWNISDVTVSGRYKEDKHSDFLALRGSTNQRLTFKGAYKNKKISDGKNTEMLVDILDNGEIRAGGFLQEEMDDLLKQLRK